MKNDSTDQGLRFECQGSGKCCTSRGSYGYVYLTPNDRKRFAAYFKMEPREFTREYCEREYDFVFLKNPEADCLFLKDKQCSVYEARPEQCRTWPFWPENMNAKGWVKEIADFCPGIGKGKLYTREEISRILKKKGAAERESPSS